ncbi:MAG: hypothetical protein JSV53_07810 [candidate division WOR-3 bacterium]|nr:MAG: hypothetical protein JSV53_07810 [candidate division WOR-3 bacterium]
MMKKRLLGLLAVAVMCLVTCGNEAPEPFYEGTPEDDEQIDAILTDDYPQLLNTVDGFVDTYIPLNIPNVAWADQDRIFRADSPIIKQHIDSCRFVFVDTNRIYDRWYTKDTACTVYLIDTFMVESWAHVDLRVVGHYDSLYIGPTGDTNWVLRTVDSIIPTGADAYDMEDIEGDGRRLIFLEPLRSTTPDIDPETGDTTYAIIEPFEWQLRRISYGSYYYPTRGTDVPTVNRVLIEVPPYVDTILATNTDTLYTGHVMNRFKHIDSLLEYSGVDSVLVTIEVDDPEVSAVCAYYAACAGDTPQRAQLGAVATGGRGYLHLNGQGIVNLYFEVVFRDSYYYVSPNQGYYATVWLVPVRIN